MGLFKKFLKTRKLPVGFATIHKKDDSDAHLKPTANCHACKVAVGFASIHKEDTDWNDWQKLSGKEHSAENAEHVHVGSGAHHQAYLAKEAELHNFKKEAEAKYKAAADSYTHHPSPASQVNRHRMELDKVEFAHHHELNNRETAHKVQSGAQKGTTLNGMHKRAIGQYTHRSSRLNKWLIAKHTEPKLKAPRTAKRDMYHGELSVADLHHFTAKETNHKGNALHHSTIVHSGVGPEMSKHLETMKVGDQVHFPAYTSTSTAPHVAHSFAGGLFGKVGDDERSEHYTKHVVHFHLPKGYHKGRHVENISQNTLEHEMILHHGQTFKKVDHGEVHSHWISPAGNKRKDSVIHHHFVPVD